MQSKNKKGQTLAESRYVYRVKSLPCGLCGCGGGEYAPSEAHELEQGQWFTTIPLCADCHRGPVNGLHGQKSMWKIHKATELTVLNDTIRKLVA